MRIQPLSLASLSLVLLARTAVAQTPASPPPASPPSAPPTPAAAPESPTIEHRPAGLAWSHERVVIGATVLFPHLVERVEVHYRTDVDATWRTLPLQRGDGEWAAEIPAAGLRARRLDYHLTLTTRDGQTREVFATRADPHIVVVHPSPDDAQELAELTYHQNQRLEFLAGGEYTNFGARLNPGGAVCGSAAGERCDDWWYSIFGEVRYRFHRTVRSVAVRVERLLGVTTRGQGAGISQEVGLVAATTEVEFRLFPPVSVALSGILGANEQSVQVGGGARVELGVGAPARVVLGFQGIVNYGLVASAWMRFDTIPRTPLGAGVEVTNQPGANADYGVRLLLEAGQRIGRHVTIFARGGYGARRQDAGGFSLSGSVAVAF